METITLNDYKKNLETGKYKSLAGARRGAGKIQGWDADTREKAKRVAESFFAAGAPVKQPTEVTPKRGPGRPAGAATKKAAVEKPKAAVAAPAAKAAPRPKAAAAKPAPAPVKHASTRAPRTPAPLENSRGQQVTELTNVVGTISEALKAIKECQTYVGQGELREETLTVGRVLSAAVRGLEELVVKPVCRPRRPNPRRVCVAPPPRWPPKSQPLSRTERASTRPNRTSLASRNPVPPKRRRDSGPTGHRGVGGYPSPPRGPTPIRRHDAAPA
jgi:hypothetical protein